MPGSLDFKISIPCDVFCVTVKVWLGIAIVHDSKSIDILHNSMEGLNEKIIIVNLLHNFMESLNKKR